MWAPLMRRHRHIQRIQQITIPPEQVPVPGVNSGVNVPIQSNILSHFLDNTFLYLQ